MPGGTFILFIQQNLSSGGPPPAAVALQVTVSKFGGQTQGLGSPCCDEDRLVVGNARTVTITIKNAAGQLVDPSNVYAWSEAPDGTTTSLTVTRVSQGVYQATYTATTPGPWNARLSDVSTPPTGASFTVDVPDTFGPLLF